MPTYNELREAVLKWWDEHRYDVTVDGDGDEWNVFDETPEFVEIAQKLKGQDNETR